MTIITTRAEVSRDRWGRPLIAPPGGGKPVPYQRTTRFVAALSDTYSLSQWQRRQVATGLAARPDLLLAASTADPTDKAGLDRICEQAAEAAGAKRAATVGAALHRLTERVDLGQDTGPVPEAHRADIAAFQRETSGLQVAAVEQFRVNDELKVAGTADRIVRWRGKLHIADVKTGSVEHDVGRIAMQLAMYAHSVPYDPAVGERRPDPEPVDLGSALIVHLPAGEGHCELIWVNIREGWEACQLAAKVWAWRKHKLRDLTAAFAA
ncbi:conserved hypothetical protein [Segniliparus rotundus DSM 44985]|uniref:PD-(D/E)XK endonuclease-like domain-containing protein n=1 Tax=Segniliparus rotundus (strain ATCC BAA-972 / CDC 1076 / CIP 108378 / DSM 44985 / JCM 13578) TaxID=640132 RepID=D6ZAQ7_SEGRD|nr:PD-(D/E)XK nuclease family protein [Segniliparus rotundus]ADG98793.1 conserved hypothetical protein [Segniliparus rotundus DSM 44985]